MQKTNYFNNTIPTDTQLNYTESSKINSLIRRQRSTCQLGIVDGFILSVNATNNTQIDVGPGEGYTGGFYQDLDVEGENSGERISTITDTATGLASLPNTATGVNLAEYTSTVNNYVSLVYAEAESTPLAEIYYPYTVHNTIVTETFSVSVLTETQWNALSIEQLRQRILVGIVTANGAGIALTAASLQQAVQPKTHPTTTQPANITGTTIISVAQDTLVGSGTLRFEFGTKNIYWTAPGDTEGIAINITSSGNYFVYSNNTAYWVRVSVVYDSLPGSDQTDTIYIRSLYGRDIPLYSAQDTIHRDMIGTGTISDTNPHATSIDDITGGTSDHADLFHKNAISGDADATQLECSIDAINDRILVNNIGGSENSFLVDGITYSLLTGVAAGANGSVQFSPVTDITGRYMVYVNSAGELAKVRIGDRAGELWDNNIQIVDMRNTTAGNGTITWDDTNSSLTWTAPGEVAGAEVYTVQLYGGFSIAGSYGYYKLYSSNTDNWIIVFCNGSLGAANSSTFATSMNSTDQSEESILRLCTINWDAATEQLTNLEDLRLFFSADTRNAFLEEHDTDGRHTKALQQQLQVVGDHYAIVGKVENNNAIYGKASGTAGVHGSASATGVHGRASDDIGGRFSAANSYGAIGVADTIGVMGSVADVTGVFATAPNSALVATADVIVAIRGSAPNSAIVGQVAGVTAIYGSAPNTAVVGVAAVKTAMWGSAANTAIVGTAAGIIAISASAANTALSAEAVGNVAIKAYAPDSFAIVALCDDAYGISASVGNDYGIYGFAVDDYGIYGSANGNYALYGKAISAGATAIFGSGGLNAPAIYGIGSGGAGGVGVHGNNVQANGYGVLGQAALGTGVYGQGVTAFFAEGDVVGGDFGADPAGTAGHFHANGTGVRIVVSGGNANTQALVALVDDQALFMSYSGRHVDIVGGVSVSGLPISIDGAIKAVGIFETA